MAATDGSLNFDTAIDTKGFDEGTEDLKSMSAQIVKAIENMGKQVTDAVNRIDTSKVAHQVENVEKSAAKTTRSVKKTKKALDDFDNVDGIQSIQQQIDADSASLDKLIKLQKDWDSMQIPKDSAGYVQLEQQIDEYRNSIAMAKGELKEMQVEQMAMDNIAKASTDIQKQTVSEYKAREAEKIAAQKAEAAAAKEAAKTDVEAIARRKFENQQLNAAVKDRVSEMAKEANRGSFLQKAYTGVSGTLRNFGGVVSKGIGGFKKLGKAGKSALNLIKGHTIGSRKAMDGFGGTISKSMKRIKAIAKTILFFRLFRSAFTALKNQLGGMLKANAQFNNSLARIKGNLLTAFQPIYDTIMPWINMMMDGLTALTSKLAQFTSALFGKTVSSSQAAAEALNEQAAATDKTAKSTERASADIDEFHVLNDNSSNGSDSSSDAPIFDVDTSDTGASEFADKLKESWSKADFTEVGEIISGKVNDMLGNIDWSTVQSTTTKIAKSGATFFNGAVSGLDWKLLGGTIGNGLSTALLFAYTFLTTFNFIEYGKKIGEGLNSSIAEFDWSLLGITLASMLNGAFDWLFGFLSTFDWKNLGKSIAQSITDFFKSTNWQELGMDISSLAIGIVDMLTNFLINIDWHAIVSAVFDVIKGIDWASLIQSLIKLIVTTCLSFISMIFDVGYEIGTFLIDGLKGGIVDIIMGIGSWIHENIIKPICDAICDFFGIHSPSTLFADYGKNLIEGLKNGIKDTLNIIVDVINDVIDKITKPFKKIGSILYDVFSDAWDKVVSVFKVETFTKIASSIGNTFKSIINRLISGINNVIAFPFNKLGDAFDTLRNVSILGVSPFGFLPKITAPQIPYLATGAVIPANNPFVAMLGDQKHGTNIETPEKLLRQIMQEEISKAKQNGQDINVSVELIGEMSALFKAFIREYKKQADKTGKDPLLGI